MAKFYPAWQASGMYRYGALININPSDIDKVAVSLCMPVRPEIAKDSQKKSAHYCANQTN